MLNHRYRWLRTLLLAGVVALILPASSYARIEAQAIGPSALPRHIYLPAVRVAPPAPQPPLGAIYLGIYFPPQFPFDSQLASFENEVGRHHGIYHYYAAWSAGWNPYLIDILSSHNVTPMISWMSVPGPWQGGCSDTTWNLDSILSGGHDDLIRSFAQGLAAWKHPVFIRWGHEMNLYEYSWSGTCNGGDQAAVDKYIAAYRHIHDIFKAMGANNAIWVWSPYWVSSPSDAWNSYNNYYPGDGYVDWICLIGYNFGADSPYTAYRWLTFTDMFDAPLRDMAARHPSKPVMLEFSSDTGTGGDKATWFRDAYAAMPNYPNLRAAVPYSEQIAAADFRIDSSTDVLNVYRAAISGPSFTSIPPYH